MTPIEQWIRWLQGAAIPDIGIIPTLKLEQITRVEVSDLRKHSKKLPRNWKRLFRQTMLYFESQLDDRRIVEDVEDGLFFDEEGDWEFWERD